MTQAVKLICLQGQAIQPYLSELAKLRITIFKDYPYLYLGNMDYEIRYLQTYIACPESLAVVVLDGDNVVGASTALPMTAELAEFQQPFRDQAISLDRLFYFGESVLLPAYRGKNIYRQFFQLREAAAREQGCTIAAFCAVERAENDSRRPPSYTALDNIWQHFGYQKHPELCAHFEWQEIGESSPSLKPLIFWLKNL